MSVSVVAGGGGGHWVGGVFGSSFLGRFPFLIFQADARVFVVPNGDPHLIFSF